MSRLLTAGMRKSDFVLLLVLLLLCDIRLLAADGLPESVRATLLRRYPSAKVVEVSDLAPEDQALWKTAHGKKSPGYAKGGFRGRRGPCFAVCLIKREEGRLLEAVVVAELPSRGDVRLSVLSDWLETTTPSVVRKEKRGLYWSADGIESVETRYDVIIYEKLEAGAILFYWTGTAFGELTISE